MFGLLLARMNIVKLHAARYYKLLVVISLIIIVWWLQNYNSGYFWMWGPHQWPLSGAIAIAMIIVATALLISPSDQKPDIWRKGGIGYLIKSLEWCGFHCYGIYVWHAVLAIVNHQLWKIPVGSPLLGLLLLAVPIAPLSYKLIEKPMLRFKMTHR